MNISLPEGVKREIARLAAEDGRSASNYITRILLKLIQAQGGKSDQ